MLILIQILMKIITVIQALCIVDATLKGLRQSNDVF